MKSASRRTREFGVVMGVVLGTGAFWAFRRGHASLAMGLGAAGALLLLLSFVAPTIVRPIADAWALLGRTIGRITTPILLGLVFVLVVVPLGFVLRIFGSDPLRLRRDPKATTYWIERKRRTFEPQDFERLS